MYVQTNYTLTMKIVLTISILLAVGYLDYTISESLIALPAYLIMLAVWTAVEELGQSIVNLRKKHNMAIKERTKMVHRINNNEKEISSLTQQVASMKRAVDEQE